MRTYITFLVVVVSLLASTTAATISELSTNAQKYPQSAENVQTEKIGARLLRTRVDDELSEERGALNKVLEAAKSVLNWNNKYDKVLKMSDQQLLNQNKGPNYVTDLARKFEVKGGAKEKVDELYKVGKRYNNF
ncbi:hypothetical protein PHMEG_0003563 [Phytophthora megakarya]|uniref:RxLR effector protein n=1 Tax=Phytophthora megakarya TaxID=4795 RepID=A0A225WW38_9STRA|nr:hypothetical protein PHMEG_0003563 [Phytophthora megakarya]